MKLRHIILQRSCFPIIAISVLLTSCKKDDQDPVPVSAYEVKCIVSDLQFGEGPAWSANELYFSDINASKLYRWNALDGERVYKDNSGRANRFRASVFRVK